MKTGARLPRGIRWLGLMALGGVSLAVQAEEKIVLLTSWYAQAEQGVLSGSGHRAVQKIRSRRRDPLRRTAGQRHAVAVVEAGRCDHRLRPVAAGRHSARLPGKGHCRAISVRSPGAADPCRCHLPAGAERQNPAGLQLRSGDVVAVAEGAIPAERRAGSPLYLQYSTLCRR